MIKQYMNVYWCFFVYLCEYIQVMKFVDLSVVDIDGYEDFFEVGGMMLIYCYIVVVKVILVLCLIDVD